MTLVESPSPPLSTFPRSLQNVFEEMTPRVPDDLKRSYSVNLVCTAKGDAVYYIGELRKSSEHTIGAISVRRETQEGSSDHVSN